MLHRHSRGERDLGIDHHHAVTHVIKALNELEYRGNIQVVENAGGNHDVEPTKELASQVSNIVADEFQIRKAKDLLHVTGLGEIGLADVGTHDACSMESHFNRVVALQACEVQDPGFREWFAQQIGDHLCQTTQSPIWICQTRILALAQVNCH